MVTIKLEHGEASYPEGMIDYLKKRRAKIFKVEKESTKLNRIIRTDRRHLKYARWFEFAKSNEVIDVKKLMLQYKEHIENKIGFFSSGSTSVNGWFRIDLDEVPAFIAFYNENH